MPNKNDIKIDNRFIQSQDRAEEIIDFLIAEYAIPRPIIELECIGGWDVQLWDTVNILEFPQLGIVAPGLDFQVIKISYAYDGGLTVIYTLRQVRPAIPA